jgi:hypothetical protein
MNIKKEHVKEMALRFDHAEAFIQYVECPDHPGTTERDHYICSILRDWDDEKLISLWEKLTD